MSGQSYIDQSTLDEAREAHRQGVPLSHLAGQLRCDPEHLAKLLGEPCWKQVPAAGELDLWRTDEADSQL